MSLPRLALNPRVQINLEIFAAAKATTLWLRGQDVGPLKADLCRDRFAVWKSRCRDLR
jgi:hypothetical protein